MQGQPLTEEEIENINLELKAKDLRYMVMMEDQLNSYRRLYGPLPGRPGKIKTKNKER